MQRRARTLSRAGAEASHSLLVKGLHSRSIGLRGALSPVLRQFPITDGCALCILVCTTIAHARGVRGRGTKTGRRPRSSQPTLHETSVFYEPETHNVPLAMCGGVGRNVRHLFLSLTLECARPDGAPLLLF